MASLPAGRAAAVEVTLSTTEQTYLSTAANDQQSGAYLSYLIPTALPYTRSALATSGVNVAASGFDLSNLAFQISFDLNRADPFPSSSVSTGGEINFSVDEIVGYVASGSITAIDPEGQIVSLTGKLYDYTLGSYLFESQQISRSTPNESFMLGLTEADDTNLLSGNLVGSLLPGHEYSFLFGTSLNASSLGALSSAAGAGSITLTFVPEPGTGLLVGSGLVGLCAYRRSRR